MAPDDLVKSAARTIANRKNAGSFFSKPACRFFHVNVCLLAVNGL